MKTTKAEQLEMQAIAIAFLKKTLKPGKTVYTTVKHVSKSGMSRDIAVFIAYKGAIKDISWHVANALGYKRSDNGGVKIGGCGMDMGFALVYNIGHKLFPKGFKLAKGQYGRNGDKSGFDTDGGYALKQTWL